MEKVQIDYFGETGGQARATYAQQASWISIQKLGQNAHVSNITCSVELDLSTPIGVVLDAIRNLIRANSALRTIVLQIPGSIWSTQTVSSQGRFSLSIVDETDCSARDAIAELSSRNFTAYEHPLRIKIILRDSIPARVVFVFSHLVLDGASVQLLMQQFIDLLDGKPAADLVEGWTSLKQACQEASMEDLDVQDGVARYWQGQLEACPSRIVSLPSGQEESQRWQRLKFSSPALFSGARVVARNSRTTLPSVLLAGAADILCPLDIDRFGCFYIASNRWNKRHRKYVGILNQDVILTMPLGLRDFRALAVQAFSASLRALKSGRFDPVRMLDLQRRVESIRGERFNIPVVNVRPGVVRDQVMRSGNSGKTSRVPEPCQQLDRTTLQKFDASSDGDRQPVIEIDIGASCVVLSLLIDTRFLSTEQAAGMLWSLEEKMLFASR